jgi:hypothetical protein
MPVALPVQVGCSWSGRQSQSAIDRGISCYSPRPVDTLPVAAAPPNPWRTMWFSPRVTMRRLLEAETRPSWIPVVALAAVSSALSSMQLDEAGALSASRSAMPVIIGSLQVIFGVLVGPFLLAFVGGWLGGEADPADIREVLAWSYVPIAVGSVLWIPLVLTLGTRAFGTDSEPLTGLQWLSVPLLLGIGVSYLWSLPLMVGGLAAVQRFSIGKAILCLVILSVPLLLLGAIG